MREHLLPVRPSPCPRVIVYGDPPDSDEDRDDDRVTSPVSSSASIDTRNVESRRIPSPGEYVPREFGAQVGRLASRDSRSKPSYADCWALEEPEGMEVVASYTTERCSVRVGNCRDGEMEYYAVPLEYAYADTVNNLMMDLIDGLRGRHRESGGRLDRDSVMAEAREILDGMSDRLTASIPEGTDPEDMTEDLCSVAYRHTIGAGIFEVLLTDPHIEDIYVDAPCDENRIYVTLNSVDGLLNSHLRCRTNLIADRREVSNLVNILKRESGLRFCHSSPVLETDFPEFDARATVVGYPMSPNGDAVAIRKRSSRPWTLTRLIANGTVSPKDAGLLSFLIDNRCTMLICGARGAGKSSLLSALLFELPKEQRLVTIEDTPEIQGELMRRLGYKVQTILVDERMEGDQSSRSDEALRVSLRMGESAIVLGEVRGEEARTLYQSMRTGRAGSSVLGTIHGDSAESVYNRVVHDLGISPEAFMATDVIVCLGTVKDRRSGRMIRRVNEIMSTGEEPGEFIELDDSDSLFSSPVMVRALRSGQVNRKDAMVEIRARAMMRSLLAEAGGTDERYLGPEWILIANDIVSHRRKGDTAETLTSVLKGRMADVS
ncbi:MAG: ATPase, T2SS/T4P/T4SS family [Candidatus Methanomethylophilaceae archaeon]